MQPAKIRTTKLLPNTYALAGKFDLKNNKSLLIWLNIIGVILLAAFAWFFMQVLNWLRPDIQSVYSFSVQKLADVFIFVVGVMVTIGLVLVLHEMVHGLFFWFFTKSKPTFGFKGAYAYAAAPEWFIPRDQYLMVGLAPLILLSLIGILLMPVFPEGFMGLLLLFLIINASGAVGDLAVCTWLLIKPRSVLILDFGDRIEVYEDTGKISSLV